MDNKDFLNFGQAALDFIVEYNDSLKDKNVLPSVHPGYLAKLLPTDVPTQAETWEKVLKDVKHLIVPGLTHWNSPNFHAYFSGSSSYPAMIGELICAGLSTIGFSWISSPASTELEDISMNWLGKLIGLPEMFLNGEGSSGGGVIEGSASEATLICLLAAKDRMVRRIKQLQPDMDVDVIKSKLVAYTSVDANPYVKKAGRLGSMNMKFLPIDKNGALSYLTLIKQMLIDIKAKLIPCYVVANLGTSTACGFDDLEAIGKICKNFHLWLHVDANYAGGTFVCPEYRYLMKGVEYADSFNCDPHKLLLTNYDCSALWVQNTDHLIDAFNVERVYLTHDNQKLTRDYRHWQVALGRKFRAVKLWFVMRLYGVQGLQQHIRRLIDLAEKFENALSTDDRFEIVTTFCLGFVSFTIWGNDAFTRELFQRLTDRKKIYVSSALHRERLMIRFVCTAHTTAEDIEFAWNEIKGQCDEIHASPCNVQEESD
ncbi:aromatic-L-amino-acid decarboxylase [Fopius arisanus]|uniref:Aromatic-L-amino-acid decarboxylase n=1 Tax=Fopius arisanus TaxID=64838 RepID=A0A0C9QJK0_9HYME|nr:PREDICTED: aromatic-L-amino-acid decarboxylase-like [Fopius arisanus]XP_011314296.1 PREDICTED: aromatic-L-amino-acid decarboxylase-like [Fopius arisanus]